MNRVQLIHLVAGCDTLRHNSVVNEHEVTYVGRALAQPLVLVNKLQTFFANNIEYDERCHLVTFSLL